MTWQGSRVFFLVSSSADNWELPEGKLVFDVVFLRLYRPRNSLFPGAVPGLRTLEREREREREREDRSKDEKQTAEGRVAKKAEAEHQVDETQLNIVAIIIIRREEICFHNFILNSVSIRSLIKCALED